IVSGESKHEVIIQPDASIGRLDYDVVLSDLGNPAVEVGNDLAVLDSVFDVGPDPVLHVAVHLAFVVNQGHTGAVTPQFQRRNRGRVLAPDHQHLALVVRVRLVVVVIDLGQVLARNVHHVGQIVIAGGHDHL